MKFTELFKRAMYIVQIQYKIISKQKLVKIKEKLHLLSRKVGGQILKIMFYLCLLSQINTNIQTLSKKHRTIHL